MPEGGPPRPRRERTERTLLPGIADVRICGDEATVRAYDDGRRAYLQLDAGCTDPGSD
ncbi:hypothetical protein [Streptomyces sp. NBC_00094]|uniref:hypothetical protein n=1 Tax=Streptomyces sp. NBC_00094 TaxID=2903620 RepID=UPI0022570B2A|nr:hypothetical protein [Streptomyces sp. NBC_00094]MCX5388516.1 hypothetical protein [Streptomyces sp. NBC_00094]